MDDYWSGTWCWWFMRPLCFRTRRAADSQRSLRAFALCRRSAFCWIMRRWMRVSAAAHTVIALLDHAARHIGAGGGAFGRRGCVRLPALADGGGHRLGVVEARLRHAGVPSAQGIAYFRGTPGGFQGGAGQLVEGVVVGWGGVADELVLGGLETAALAGGAVGRALHLGRERLALVPGAVAPYHRRRVGARVVPVAEGFRLVGSVAAEVGRLDVLGGHPRQGFPLHAQVVHAPAHEDVLRVFHEVGLGDSRGIGVQWQLEPLGLPGHAAMVRWCAWRAWTRVPRRCRRW